MTCKYRCQMGRELDIPSEEDQIRVLISLDQSKIDPTCEGCSGRTEAYVDDAGGTLVRREYCTWRRVE